MTRHVLLVTHTGRPGIVEHAHRVVSSLEKAGFTARVLAEEAGDLKIAHALVREVHDAAHGVELVLALGGDGTLLRAAELARPAQVPLLGINLGRVGFLAEAEIDDIDEVVRRVVARELEVDERLTLDVTVSLGQEHVGSTWALNEVAVERAARNRMLELMVRIDGHPVSRWGCDGVVCATPTGSTAYAFSAGGPVVWPEVEALLVVPLSPHALFNRSLVTAPEATVAMEAGVGVPAIATCDGRRTVAVPPGAVVEVRRGRLPVRVARLRARAFTDRLVAKFGLPVEGWRRPYPAS